MSSTLYIDPSFNSSKFRSEFRVPSQNGVYKNDMRLLNIGVSKTGGTSSYNVLTGAYGVIESIQLYSGSQLLDQVQVWSNYTALKNLLHSNSQNQSRQRPITRNKLGYVATGLDTVDGTTGNITLGVKQNNSVPDQFNNVYGANDTVLEQASNGSYLELMDCMGFLRGTPYVPMNIYKDFRVILNYKNSALIDQIKDRTAVLETLPPILVCEYETDPVTADALMRSYQGHTYDTVEHDQVQLLANDPGVENTATQEASYLVKGFNDKYISRVAIVNTPTDNSTWNTANAHSSMSTQCSVSQLQWGYQVRLNGGNLFPQTLYQGKMRRLAQMSDAWGSMNVAFGQNMCQNQGGGAVVFEATALDTIGQVDYSGFQCETVVKELKLNVQRTAVGGITGDATANKALNQALNLNMYAISRKRVVPTSQGILVQYV